ncbi:MAG: MBL fold metallo-hydrolase [Clostridia bacterium]|nr:MBL fold metallo-hydrolase [Clostridia bacterium]
MKLTYLGTGAAEGMPAAFCACPVCLRSLKEGGKSLRMRSCSLLGDDVLIDMGPDIHAQKLRFGLRLDRLRAIVYTHSHEDHEDLYALRQCGTPTAAIHPDVPEDEDILDLYGNRWVYKCFEMAMSSGHRARESHFRFHEIKPWQTFDVGPYTFHALRANHRPIVVEDCLIYAITDGKSAILYANDTGELSPEVDEYLRGIGLHFNLVSMDCARGLLPGNGHMGWAECLRLRERLEAIGAVDSGTRFVLNHLSHMNDMTHTEWEAFAAPHGIEIAYDGLVVDTEDHV